jgi:threonine aldolase
LTIDHLHAQILAEEIGKCDWVTDVLPVETNIILFDTVEPAAVVVQKLAESGIKASATDKHRIRFVLHLDIHAEQVEYAVKVLSEL